MMSVGPDTIKGHANTTNLVYHLWPCWYLAGMLLQGSCWSMLCSITWGQDDFQDRWLLKTMSGLWSYNIPGLC